MKCRAVLFKTMKLLIILSTNEFLWKLNNIVLQVRYLYMQLSSTFSWLQKGDIYYMLIVVITHLSIFIYACGYGYNLKTHTYHYNM